MISEPSLGSTVPPPAIATTLPEAQVARTWQAAQSFEAMALNEFLKPIFDTVDMSNNVFGGGSGEAAWRPMLVEAIAKQVARAGGIGIATPVFAQMLHQQEDVDQQTADSMRKKR